MANWPNQMAWLLTGAGAVAGAVAGERVGDPTVGDWFSARGKILNLKRDCKSGNNRNKIKIIGADCISLHFTGAARQHCQKDGGLRLNGESPQPWSHAPPDQGGRGRHVRSRIEPACPAHGAGEPHSKAHERHRGLCAVDYDNIVLVWPRHMLTYEAIAKLDAWTALLHTSMEKSIKILIRSYLDWMVVLIYLFFYIFTVGITATAGTMNKESAMMMKFHWKRFMNEPSYAVGLRVHNGTHRIEI